MNNVFIYAILILAFLTLIWLAIFPSDKARKAADIKLRIDKVLAASKGPA